jgi:hypothetical protein
MKQWKDYGESSLTLLAVHCGMDKAEPAVPHDSSDFARCVHLFECLDLCKAEIECLLASAKQQYPIWKPFAQHWELLTELYKQEKDQEHAPDLYDAIQKLVKQNGL